MPPGSASQTFSFWCRIRSPQTKFALHKPSDIGGQQLSWFLRINPRKVCDLFPEEGYCLPIKGASIGIERRTPDKNRRKNERDREQSGRVTLTGKGNYIIFSLQFLFIQRELALQDQVQVPLNAFFFSSCNTWYKVCSNLQISFSF